jgi:hypothetical protein
LRLASISIDRLYASLLRSPDPSWTNFKEKKKEDIRLLVSESNVHRHTSTCYKYSKNNEHKICRMRMPREVFSVTTIDPEIGEIKLRRSHPMINNFNQYIMCGCRCNMDIKFIWSGTDAKALVYYCTDYITKTNLSFHDTSSLVQKAVAPNDNNSVTENAVDKARKLVLRCYNSLASQQELSGVQAATYLMDYGDHYTSHTFVNIFLIAIERHLQNELEQNKTALDSSSTTAQTTDTNLIDFVEDEDGGNVSSTDEQFSIEQSADPQKLVLVNLRIDYQYRSSALQSVCLYEFVSLFHRKLFTNKDRDITEHPSISVEDARSSRGRPPQERYSFMTEHPQASSHGIIKRPKPIIPVLLGPQIPRKDREEMQERYSRAIAALFIPWRSVRDICDVSQNWCEALSSRQGSISRDSQQIIDNIQLLHECKKDRDAHLQQVIANVQTNNEVDPRLFPRNMRVDSDEDDDNLDQNETHLNFLDNLSNNNATSDVSHLSEKEQLYQDEVLRCLDDVSRFSNHISKFLFVLVITLDTSKYFLLESGQHFTASSSLSHFSIKTRHSEQQNAAWQAAIKSDTLRKRQQSILQDTSLPLDYVSDKVVSTTSTNYIAESATRISDRTQLVTTVTSTIPTRRQVCQKFTLNDEQARAFYIICRHADGDGHPKTGKNMSAFFLFY